jgi:sulfonate transport system ATP-binding protein
MSAIELRGLRKAFAGRTVLAGLDLDLRAGEVHALLGHSGCGKTTLLRLIAGLENPEAGTIRFAHERPRIGIVFQEPRLLPWLDVAQNLSLALRRFDVSKSEERTRIDAALSLVGLAGCAALRPAALSGGMAQRVALARALLRRPEVLLLDEPFGALDALTRRQMQEELRRLRTHLPPTTLLVTHDVAEAARLADRASLLAGGKITREFPLAGHDPRATEQSLLDALLGSGEGKEALLFPEGKRSKKDFPILVRSRQLPAKPIPPSSVLR